MCTITYLPGRDNTFILTQNRDVSPTRGSDGLVKISVADETVIYPKDSRARGTWMAMSAHDRYFCVMNGAFHPHKHTPPYRMSRGLIALQLFEYPSSAHFFKEVDLHRIEPFTMISIDRGQLQEFRWDLKDKHVIMLDPGSPHIWASSTLYSEEHQAERRKWFFDWLKSISSTSQNEILKFHKEGGNGDPENDLVMKRSNLVQTVGITQIIRNANELSLQHEDLIGGGIQQQILSLQTPQDF